MNLDPNCTAVGTNGPFIIDPNCTAVSYSIGPIQSQCNCCGFIGIGTWCLTCFKNTCLRCTWGDKCLICMTKFGLTEAQRERLENLYSPGGYKYEQAKQKLTNL